MHPLDGPRLKCERAKEHLDNLTGEVVAYYSRDPYEMLREVHPKDPNRHVFRLKIHEQPPARFGIVVGDVVHNLRSALDHLAFQLALEHAIEQGVTLTPADERGIEFPIYKDPTEFKSKGLRKIDKLPSAAQDEIESLQPYHRGQDAEMDRLWVVHHADIVDKHRQIVPRLTACNMLITFQGKDSVLVSPFEDGQIIGATPSDADPDKVLQPAFAPEILFDIGVARPIALDGFYSIHKFISDDVLPRFTGFFKQPI